MPLIGNLMFDLFDRLPFLRYVYFTVLLSCLMCLTLKSFNSSPVSLHDIQWFLWTSRHLCDFPFPPFLLKSLALILLVTSDSSQSLPLFLCCAFIQLQVPLEV